MISLKCNFFISCILFTVLVGKVRHLFGERCLLNLGLGTGLFVEKSCTLVLVDVMSCK